MIDDYNTYEFTGKEFGAIVQYPAANGEVRDYAAFTEAAHAKGALVTAVADLLSLALLKAPGEWGADIVVGTTQRLGIPMGFGGPSAGYMTTREAISATCRAASSAYRSTVWATVRSAWRSRPANSTSSASVPPRTSAPLRH